MLSRIAPRLSQGARSAKLHRVLSSVSASQVAISMVASPIHPHDSKAGKGSEGVGRVTSVGSSVQNLKEGDWVVPKLGFGAWVKDAVVEAASVTPVCAF
jgi:NADPH:quinone reductase-like Zn-dependent oxidoreductase